MQNQEWINSEDKFPDKITFYFPTALYISAVRHNVSKIAKRMGFKDEHAFNISLAVDEAYVNAVEHGACNVDAEVKVEFSVYSDRLEVSVSDTGCGFNVDEFDIPEDFNLVRTVRGRGLGLIKILTDEMDIESSVGNGTTIKFVKYIESRA